MSLNPATRPQDTTIDAWDALTSTARALAGVAPDVEARRVPADAGMGNCGTVARVGPFDGRSELVGRIRRRWRGFEGGDDVRSETEEFFAGVFEPAADGSRP